MPEFWAGGSSKPTRRGRLRIRASFPQSLRNEATIEGRVVRFLPSEYKVLEVLLMAHPDRSLTLGDIISILWPNPNHEPNTPETLIKVQITRLRKFGAPIYHTGSGYSIPRECRYHTRSYMRRTKG